MNAALKRIVFWTPRIAGLLIAGFISLFALDVFGQGYGFWTTSGVFLIHLIPTGLVLMALAVAWRWEWIGAALFAALGGAYVIVAWGRFTWLTYAIVSGPLFGVGILFLVNWLYRAELRPGR